MTETNPSQKTKSSRQNIRKWILILSFILIPVTIFYISPIVIMMGASEGIATGSLILYTALLITSLVVARLWCGWLCPMGAWQEICSPVMKHTVADGWRNYVKYIVTALWLALIASLFLTAGGIRAVNPLFGTTNGISVTSMEIMMIVTIIFLIIFAIAYFTGRRGYCHVLCPIAGLMIAGRKIRNLIGWPAVQLDANPSRCIDCGKCSEECPMGLDVHTMVKDGEMENAECIDCANCADTCPKGAITFGLKKK